MREHDAGRVRSRNKQYAAYPTRKVRFAARQRGPAYVDRYSRRIAYAPWWSPVPYWQAY